MSRLKIAFRIRWETVCGVSRILRYVTDVIPSPLPLQVMMNARVMTRAYASSGNACRVRPRGEWFLFGVRTSIFGRDAAVRSFRNFQRRRGPLAATGGRARSALHRRLTLRRDFVTWTSVRIRGIRRSAISPARRVVET